MKHTRIFWFLALVCLFFAAAAQAQTSAVAAESRQSGTGASGPAPAAPALRLVKFSGTLKDRLGRPLSGVVGLTLALYKDQQGGAPLWLETQNVELDEQGHYTVLLGATQSEGLPLELFTTGEQRWLGVQVILPGAEEEPRLLLVSVPYALKAAEAETLGGKPLSAFVLAEPSAATAGEPTKLSQKGGPGPVAVNAGTANYIGKFVNTTDLVNSVLYEASGNIGLGTTNPLAPLHIAGIQGHRNLNLATLQTGAYPGIMLENTVTSGSVALTENSGLSLYITPSTSADFTAADLKLVVDQSGKMGVGTSTPGAKLEVAGNVKASAIAFPDGSVQSTAWPGVPRPINPMQVGPAALVRRQ